MDKHPVLRNIWCANAWVGAPWACGDDHQQSKKNTSMSNSSSSGMCAKDCPGNVSCDDWIMMKEDNPDLTITCDDLRSACATKCAGCNNCDQQG